MQNPLKDFLLMVLLVAIATTAHSQDNFEVSGRIVDSDSIPLPFVHVYIPDVLLGTISNRNGEFKLSIEDKMLGHDLVFSSVGYAKQSIPLASLKDKFTNVLLKESDHMLSEVVIMPNYDDSARQIVLNAVSQMKDNYDARLFYLDGFYREVSYRDSLVTRLIEAAVRLNSKSYRFNKDDLSADKLKIDVLQIRKSDDNRVYTSWDEAAALMFGKENSLYQIFREDYIRYIDSKSYHFLSREAVEGYLQYKIEDVITEKEDTVYVINADSKSPIQKRKLRFYISKKDWAFVKFEQEVRFNVDKRKTDVLRKNTLILKSTTLYTEYQGKYYLNYLDVLRYANGATPVLASGELQYDHLQFMVNNVYKKGDDQFEKIKRKEVEDQDQSIYSISDSYDECFWDSYNMIMFYPLSSQVLEGLGKERSLESQFEQNH